MHHSGSSTNSGSFERRARSGSPPALPALQALSYSPPALRGAAPPPSPHALLSAVAARGDLHFVFAPPRLGAPAVEMEAEVAALRGALARGARACAACRSEASLYSLSRLLHVAHRHAGAARRFYEAHAATADRAHQWASRALAVERALEGVRAEVAALAPGWRRVGPDACDDVWWEKEGAPASWVIPLRP